MDIVTDIAAVPDHLKGGVVVIGNFDGVHLGHQRIMKKALELARDRNIPALLLTFEPHPRSYFKPDQPPYRLTRSQDKCALVESYGFDGFIELDFNKELAGLNAGEFIDRILIAGLDTTCVVVGENFVFGKDRSGDIGVLKNHGGFDVEVVNLYADDRAYSSTRVRNLLREGNPKGAAALLGRPWRISSKVVVGARQGHRIGFATANLELGEYLRPMYGVYAVIAHLLHQDLRLKGVANIGVRPTVGGRREFMEVHLFDFDSNIYGEEMEVEMIDFIRPEQKFANVAQLQQQIKADIEKTEQILDSF